MELIDSYIAYIEKNIPNLTSYQIKQLKRIVSRHQKIKNFDNNLIIQNKPSLVIKFD